MGGRVPHRPGLLHHLLPPGRPGLPGARGLHVQEDLPLPGVHEAPGHLGHAVGRREATEAAATAARETTRATMTTGIMATKRTTMTTGIMATKRTTMTTGVMATKRTMTTGIMATTRTTMTTGIMATKKRTKTMTTG